MNTPAVAAPVPMDPEAEALLAQMRARYASMPPSAHPLSPAEQLAGGREGYRATIPLAGEPEPVYRIENRNLPGPAGLIPVRFYVPNPQESLPILVYFHGGSFVAGDLETHERPLRALANRSGCIIASVQYRLAPEHPFPAAPEDCYAATVWIAGHAREVGADPGRIAIGGDSAGGDLAAVVALMSRDRSGPKFICQVLINPNTDLTLRSASWQELGAKGYILSTQGMQDSVAMYVPEQVDKKHPYLSPLWAPDLAHLPPALVVTSGYDPLREEGRQYAARLKGAGIPVRELHYPGMIHGFFQMGGVLAAGRQAMGEIAGYLQDQISR